MSKVIRGGHGSVGCCPAARWRLFLSLTVSSVLASGSSLSPAHPCGSALGTSLFLTCVQPDPVVR